MKEENNNKKVYILLMHSGTIPAKAIKFYTKYNYSHVAISLDKSCTTIYSFGRKKLNNPLNGGFVIENKNGEFFNKFNKTKCRIYELDVTNEEYEKIETKLTNMTNKKDMYKYDFLGLGLRVFHIPVSFKNRYVCSSFVASIIEQAGVYKFNKKYIFVRPKDFETLNANVIYEGKYKEYVGI